MFCMYGKSLPIARDYINKQLDKSKADVTLELKESEGLSQTHKQAIIDKHVQKYFKDMKPKKCSPEFSTPEIMEEAYQIMLKDTTHFSDLVRMKKVPRLNADGEPSLSKKTGKPLMDWVPFYRKVELKVAA